MSKDSKNKFKAKGNKLFKIIEEFIHQGNIRRIIIKDDKGRTYLEMPLTFGLVGTMFAPMFVAITAIAGAANKFTIELEKRKEEESVVVEVKDDEVTQDE